MSRLFHELSKEETSRLFNSKFVQQRLPTFNPVLNTTTVIPSLFLVSIIFIPLGIGIYLFSENVGEVIVEYTNCISVEDPGRTCDQVIRNINVPTSNNQTIRDCTCVVDIAITNEELNKGSVYMYYYLTNHYYQNRKNFYDSKDERQLLGEIGSLGKPNEPSWRCRDFQYDSLERPILPCGAIANWMFSDSIELYDNMNTKDGLYSDAHSSLVPLIRTGIALESDRARKYKNPKEFYANEEKMRQAFGRPPAWKKSLWELDPLNKSNNGLQNEDFIIWMRVSAFPDFRKLYRVVNTTAAPYEDGLPPGNYSLKINYNYVVSTYKGTKSIIFITTSLIGGQNHFLGVAYLVVGGICMFFTTLFFVIHILSRQKFKNCYNIDKED